MVTADRYIENDIIQCLKYGSLHRKSITLVFRIISKVTAKLKKQTKQNTNCLFQTPLLKPIPEGGINNADCFQIQCLFIHSVLIYDNILHSGAVGAYYRVTPCHHVTMARRVPSV